MGTVAAPQGTLDGASEAREDGVTRDEQLRKERAAWKAEQEHTVTVGELVAFSAGWEAALRLLEAAPIPDGEQSIEDFRRECARLVGPHGERLQPAASEREPDGWLAQIRSLHGDWLDSIIFRQPFIPPAPTPDDPMENIRYLPVYIGAALNTEAEHE